jgi:uncharacterized protein YdhG (YjbR/CyaY superfamily)
MSKPSLIEDYINQFTGDLRVRLIDLRSLIQQLVPDCSESMAYGMPAYKYKGKPLIYFAGYKKHIGVYASPEAHASFSNELSVYKQGKGSVQFPLHEKLPLELITKMILFKKQSLDFPENS